MDASTFRWVLIIIALLLAIGIYLFGQHQARLRKRNAIETFTREEIDSAFVEDEQLRFEMNNLNQILRDNEAADNLDEIQINPAREAQKTPFALPDPEIFVPSVLASKDQDRFISYHLRHDDFRLITGEEAEAAVQHAGLELRLLTGSVAGDEPFAGPITPHSRHLQQGVVELGLVDGSGEITGKSGFLHLLRIAASPVGGEHHQAGVRQRRVLCD